MNPPTITFQGAPVPEGSLLFSADFAKKYFEGLKADKKSVQIPGVPAGTLLVPLHMHKDFLDSQKRWKYELKKKELYEAENRLAELKEQLKREMERLEFNKKDLKALEEAQQTKKTVSRKRKALGSRNQ